MAKHNTPNQEPPFEDPEMGQPQDCVWERNQIERSAKISEFLFNRILHGSGKAIPESNR